MQSKLDYALAYAELGWFVFPCHWPIKKTGWNCSCEVWKRKNVNENFECSNAGKHPRTPNGLDDATTDPEQIRKWWKKWPDANIGINCGLSGLLVVDLDTYKDIYSGHNLELNEETITGLTGGGGVHNFYQQEPTDNFGNRNKNLPDGIDIRGHGGYVVVTPSTHVSGREYQWELEYSPWGIEPAPIPAKLRELLEQSQQSDRTVVHFDTTPKFDRDGTPYGLAALNNQCHNIEIAANGTRNNTLNTAAFAIGQLVAGGEIDERYAYDNLYAAAASSDLSTDEAQKTIESGMAAGFRQPYSSVILEDAYDGFGECPNPALLFNRSVDDEEIVRPVHIDEVQEAIDTMFKTGKTLEQIREAYWLCIGNLKMSDRRLLATFLFNIGLISSAKTAGQFVDDCAGRLQSVPLIERVIDAINALGYEFKLNLLEDTIEANGRRLDKHLMSEIFLLLQDKKFNRIQVEDGINVISQRKSYHPVRDYLLSLKWDGKSRLKEFLSYLKGDGKKVTYHNGTEAPLHWLLFRRWILGCVARAIDGGDETAFKHQTPVLVLIGAQGRGKSSMVRWLASDIGFAFHREGPLDPNKTDDKRSAVTRWLWEIPELGSSLRKTDRDAMKGFITQEWHTYRKPFERYDITKPTSCVPVCLSHVTYVAMLQPRDSQLPILAASSHDHCWLLLYAQS